MHRLRQIREAAGLSQVKLAQLSNTTGQQIGRLELGKIRLSKEWADRLAPHLGISAAELLFGDEPGIVSPSSQRLTHVVGAVEAGSWREATEWPQDEHYTVNIYDDRFPDLIGLEVRGDSMNKLYKAGTVLICRQFDPTNEIPPVGKRVIVQRRIASGLIEATVKLLEIDADGQAVLMPQSTNDDYKPIPYSPSGDGDGDVQITAIVVGAYTRE